MCLPTMLAEIAACIGCISGVAAIFTWGGGVTSSPPQKCTAASHTHYTSCTTAVLH